MNTTSAQEFDVNLRLSGQLGNAILGELNTLRELDPVHWSESSQCWIVTRHDDITDALNGEFPLSYERLVQATFPSVPVEDRERLYPNMMRYVPNWIIDMDPPRHPRMRKLLTASFNKKVMDAVRPFVVERVAMLMDKLAAQPETEFGEEIARLLPGSVILKLLGVPQENLPRLRDWSSALNSAIAAPGVTPEMLRRCENALIDMNKLFAEVIEQRRAKPESDLISALLEAEDSGDKLTQEEIYGACQLIIVAGHDTTHNSLSLGMALLAKHPEFWDYMYQHPEKTMECTLELIRYMAMSACQPRFVAEDFEWHGKKIKKGDILFLMFATGNRDPRVFSDPDKLDFNRSNNDKSLAFAPGLHHCIGHLLAKLQLTQFFGELVKRFEGAELLDDTLHFQPQVIFRGLFDLNVKVTPRAKH